MSNEEYTDREMACYLLGWVNGANTARKTFGPRKPWDEYYTPDELDKAIHITLDKFASLTRMTMDEAASITLSAPHSDPLSAPHSDTDSGRYKIR